MEKRNKADELIGLIESIEPLEEVPAKVSARFHATLSQLSAQDARSTKKKKWVTGSNQFALAASFVLVFALGTVLTLNSDGNSPGPLGVNQNQPSTTPTENDFKEDQLLYSGGESSIPETTNLPIKFSNSAHDYQTIPEGFQKIIGVGATWNSASNLEPTLSRCLKSLGLNESTNLIDAGLTSGKAIKAIWTPINSVSWNVYLIDAECSVIDKKFVQD
jgi:hypothetical protein